MTPKALSRLINQLGNAIQVKTIEDKNWWIGQALSTLNIEELSTKENK